MTLTGEQLGRIMNTIDRELNAGTERKTGFALVAFDLPEGAHRQPLDARWVANANPELVTDIFREMVKRFDAGDLPNMPSTAQH